MRSNCLLAVALMTSALSGVQVADAQNVGATGDAVSSATDAAVPVVTDQAERLLRQMGEYVGSAEQFTFHADITFDHVLPSGQKLHTPRPRTWHCNALAGSMSNGAAI